MGAPFDTGTWEGVVDTYYNAVGTEAIWLFASIALCVIALVAGGIHEAKSYRKVERDHTDL